MFVKPRTFTEKLAQDIYSFLLNFQISFKLEANDKIPDFFNIFSTFFLNFFNFKQKKPGPFTHFFHIFKFRTIISVFFFRNPNENFSISIFSSNSFVFSSFSKLKCTEKASFLLNFHFSLLCPEMMNFSNFFFKFPQI